MSEKVAFEFRPGGQEGFNHIQNGINLDTHNEYKFGKRWDIVTEKKLVERHSSGGRRELNMTQSWQRSLQPEQVIKSLGLDEKDEWINQYRLVVTK